MNVAIEKQKDGTYIVYNIDGEGTIIGSGDSVKGAKEDFFNSMKEVAEACSDANIKKPSVLENKVVFKFDLSSLFEYYSMLNMSALADFIGINKTLLRQYKQGNTYISEKQLLKIETGLHNLGDELSKLRLV